MQKKPKTLRKRRIRKKAKRSDSIFFGIYKSPVFRLVSKYILSISIFALLYSFFDGSSLLQKFYIFNASLTGIISNLYLPDVVTKSDVVYAGTFGLKIVSECTSIIPTGILIAGIAAFPSSISNKLIGAIVGIVLLGFLNLIRISSLLYIGSTFPSIFETAHILIWQSLMISAAIFFWILWWKYIVSNNFSSQP